MKHLLLAMAITASVIGLINQAFAIDVLSIKASGSNISKIADSEVERVWKSETPACIKDGSRLLGVNKAYLAKHLKYADCSVTDKAREKQRMLGFSIVKIDFVSLSDSMAKTVNGKLN